MNLSDFNDLLFNSQQDDLRTFVQKYLIHGTPHVFTGNDDGYFEFRNKIAKRFNIGFNDVFIVGSAKQGFSYIKDRDSFNYESDVDVAIVSRDLFDNLSQIFRDYQYRLSAGKETLSLSDDRKYKRFLKWYVRGWIRPDLISAKLIKNYEGIQWDKFFKSISFGKSEVGNYKVAAGVFKSYDDLETYHYQGVNNHFLKLKGEGVK